MKVMQNGEFFGVQDRKLELDAVTLTCTTYTHSKVDWHRHENAYFTFLLAGKMAEINRKDRYDCTPGSLLFHHSDEAHYNLKPKDHTQGFHIELQPDWLARYGAKVEPGSYPIYAPGKKLIVFELFREFLHFRIDQMVAIDFLIHALIQDTGSGVNTRRQSKPRWVATVRDLIHDSPAQHWTLTELSRLAGVHPNYFCRAFPRYFGTTLGRYLRMVRIQRALILMISSKLSLSEISHTCGFADQSHFIRTFRDFHQLTPLAYRKQLVSQPG